MDDLENLRDYLDTMAGLQPLVARGELEVAPMMPTGLHGLDRALRGGIPRDKLTVIGARTSHGKTAITIRLAVNYAMAGRMVQVIWLEDGVTDLGMRVLSAITEKGLPEVYEAHRRGRADRLWAGVAEGRREAVGRIHVLSLERPEVARVADEIRRAKRNSVTLIDHLGEIRWGPGLKHEAMGDGVRELRAAGRYSSSLVVAMAQLNRDWDRRKAAAAAAGGDAMLIRPVLSDIENSGQIEQAARVCILAEKRLRVDETPTGEYLFHVFKPTMAIASCVWDDTTCTPTNPEPIPVGEHVQADLPLPPSEG